MPRITIDLPVCYRCHHVWLPELEPGEKPAMLRNLKWVAGKRKVPKYCASCKDPNWDRRRKYHMRAVPRKKPVPAAQRVAQVQAMSGEDIFNQVMKTVKNKD